MAWPGVRDLGSPADSAIRTGPTKWSGARTLCRRRLGALADSLVEVRTHASRAVWNFVLHQQVRHVPEPPATALDVGELQLIGRQQPSTVRRLAGVLSAPSPVPTVPTLASGVPMVWTGAHRRGTEAWRPAPIARDAATQVAFFLDNRRVAAHEGATGRGSPRGRLPAACGKR